VFVIPGTTKDHRLAENNNALNIKLSDDDLKLLD
jgi:diketogulonate reductase-like aldo/keto reductase